jgi:hypothetical protein
MNINAASIESQDASLSSKEIREVALLEKINEAQKALGRSTKYIKLPDVAPEVVEALSGKRIVMVDDIAGQLAKWHPVLLTATNGTADFVWHTEETRSALLDRITASNPEVVLLDYELSKGVRGTELVDVLRERLPGAVIIGFSSDRGYNTLLRDAGTHGTANKGAAEAEQELFSIVVIVSRYSQAPEPTCEDSTLNSPPSPSHLALSATDPFGIRGALENSCTEEMVTRTMELLAAQVALKKTAPEFTTSPYDEVMARVIGAVRFRGVLERLTAECKSPLEKFLVVVSDRSYYDPDFRKELRFRDDYYDTEFERIESLRTHLPSGISHVVEGQNIIGAVTNGRDFALLFDDERARVRRIVTPDRLIQLSDVCGYKYLDMDANGAPFVRCVTSRGGGRAFFDGERLMSHQSFHTCAPRVSFFDGGYIVNSTHCTIINGMLYSLINEADKVAHTDGAFCGMVDFTNAEALESYAQNQALADLLKIDAEGVIHLPDREVAPIGVFKPSTTTLLANGFTQYEWSEFCPL